MAATPALRRALNDGISSGSFVDTKIILYSYRNSSGRVCRPKALYTNSHILKTVPYFNDRESAPTLEVSYHSRCHFQVLFGNFAESTSRDFTEETVVGEVSAEDYGYLSDSDLEDDGDNEVPSCRCETKPKVNALGPPGALCEEHEERIEEGKVVKIPDTAFVT